KNSLHAAEVAGRIAATSAGAPLAAASRRPQFHRSLDVTPSLCSSTRCLAAVSAVPRPRPAAVWGSPQVTDVAHSSLFPFAAEAVLVRLVNNLTPAFARDVVASVLLGRERRTTMPTETTRSDLDWNLWGKLRPRYEELARAGGPYRLLAL